MQCMGEKWGKVVCGKYHKIENGKDNRNRKKEGVEASIHESK